jgi:hypothetical protein
MGNPFEKEINEIAVILGENERVTETEGDSS